LIRRSFDFLMNSLQIILMLPVKTLTGSLRETLVQI